MVGVPVAQVEAWLSNQASPAATETEAGLVLFLDAGCGECHTIRGAGANGSSGPDLTHMASRNTIGASTLDNARPELMRWVADPHAVKEGVKMPATELTSNELKRLTDFLEALE